MELRYTITLAGIDITSYVIDLPIHTQRKNPYGQLVDVPSIQLECDNTYQVFTPGHLHGLLDTDWQYEPVQIWDSNLVIFEGVLRNVDAGSSRATMELSSGIGRILEKQVPAYYSEQKTLAEISHALYSSYGVSVDRISYYRASAKQKALGLQAVASISPDLRSTLMMLQQQLADLGLCRHYFINDVAYMDFTAYQKSPFVTTSFFDEDVIAVKEYSLLDTQRYDGYLIRTVTGDAVRTGIHRYPEINASSDAAIQFVSPASGYAFGDALLDLKNKQQHRIIIHLKQSSKTAMLTLHSIVQIACISVPTQKFEIMAIEPTHLGVMIEGLSV